MSEVRAQTIEEDEALLRRLGVLHDGEKLVKVKSWVPSLDEEGMGWPVMLVDRAGTRTTVVPIWDCMSLARLRVA